MSQRASILSLSGDWALTLEDGPIAVACPIPGDVHSALMAAGQIPDPHYGLNEDAVAWVADRVWLLSRELVVEAEALGGCWPVLDLTFVDTLAEVRVNDQLVGQLDSVFQRHQLDLTGIVKPGVNTITFRFLPVAAEAARRAAALPFPIPYSASNNKIPHLNTIRKAQCHGGWDWGLSLLAIGIYEEPTIKLYRAARIEHVRVGQEHRADGSVVVHADVELVANAPSAVPVTVSLDGQNISQTIVIESSLTGKARLSVVVVDANLWWPVGLGAQPLYELTVAIPGAEVVRRVGLRSLQIVTEKDAAGSSMIVRVNGQDVFARGANWIPADALPARADAGRLARLLDETLAANMNMLRVWGGGFYETELFYELCDARGIMIWQDMMFACSQYPSTPEFLSVVDSEIRYQIKRLSSHPSIAIWCGDNEVIGSLTWYEESRNNRDRYLVNYDRLNRTIEQAVLDSDTDRRFWPSSPCNGDLDYGDAWHDDGSGDMHYWSVWHENKPFEAYYDIKPRFCSEFGFQSFPTMVNVAQFSEVDQWNATSPVMEFHQRDRAGNARIIETMARLFRMPESFDQFVYLSQLQQALAIEMAVRYWRSLKPHCMGAIYWQLNDVWPAVSWSSLDHSLAWKTLHYHVKRFFAPVSLGARVVDGVLWVSVVNDTRADVTLDVRIRRLGLDGALLNELSATVLVPTDQSVAALSAPALASAASFLVVDAKVAGAAEFDPLLQVVVLTEQPKRYALPTAMLTIADVLGDLGAYVIRSDVPAFYVKLEARHHHGAFDDASFLVLPGEERVVRFRAYGDEAWPKADEITLQAINGAVISV